MIQGKLYTIRNFNLRQPNYDNAMSFTLIEENIFSKYHPGKKQKPEDTSIWLKQPNLYFR